MKNGASKLKNHLDQDSWLGHSWHSKFAFTTLESPQCRAWTASTKIIPRPLTWRKGGKNKKIVRCIFAMFADQISVRCSIAIHMHVPYVDVSIFSNQNHFCLSMIHPQNKGISFIKQVLMCSSYSHKEGDVTKLP